MYRTNALALASYLCTVDSISFSGVDRSEPSKIIFEFEPMNQAQKAADEYFSDKATVNPREFMEKYRSLKDLVFEVKRNMPSDN